MSMRRIKEAGKISVHLYRLLASLKRTVVFFSLIATASVYLLACTSQTPFDHKETTPSRMQEGVMVGAVVGAVVTTASAGLPVLPAGLLAGGIAGGAIGDYLDRYVTEVDRLHKAGIRVIRVGDQVRVLLPTDRVFFPNTPVINPNYYPALTLVAKVLRAFHGKDTIRVAAYTDDLGWEKRNVALSKMQAQHIADFLWKQSLDARLIYAEGEGSTSPIASNETAWGRLENKRVVISFNLLAEH